jgi:hypothetical protein
MFRRGLIGLLLVLSGAGCAPDSSDTSPPNDAFAQSSGATAELQTELVVARDILRNYAKHRVVVDSIFAVPEQAPGAASNEVRPHMRTQALNDSVADNPDSARTVFLRLSRPRINGGVARITATVDFPNDREPGRRGYETVEYTLASLGASWQVRTRIQLGIT